MNEQIQQEVELRFGQLLDEITVPVELLQNIDIRTLLSDALEHHNVYSLRCSPEMYRSLCTIDVLDMNMHQLVNALNCILSTTPTQMNMTALEWVDMHDEVNGVVVKTNEITHPHLQSAVKEVHSKHKQPNIVPASSHNGLNKQMQLGRK